MTVATKKLLLDVREAGESILENTAGKSLAEYSRNRLLRRAVEREFEIIGGNRIIHGYDTIDDTVVWGVAEQNLPALIQEVTLLLAAEEAK